MSTAFLPILRRKLFRNNHTSKPISPVAEESCELCDGALSAEGENYRKPTGSAKNESFAQRLAPLAQGAKKELFNFEVT